MPEITNGFQGVGQNEAGIRIARKCSTEKVSIKADQNKEKDHEKILHVG